MRLRPGRSLLTSCEHMATSWHTKQNELMHKETAKLHFRPKQVRVCALTLCTWQVTGCFKLNQAAG